MALGAQRQIRVQPAGSPGVGTIGNYNLDFTVTGTGPTSGEGVGTSGPFMIETQDLTIDYVRVPIGRMTAVDLTLSSCIPSYSIESTGMAVRVRANYSRRKDDAYYDPSAFQQPQKFEVYAVSSDASGNGFAVSGGDSMTSGFFPRRKPPQVTP